MSFLNQQYAKMSTGQEILSEMYTKKTVHGNRKKKMKENLLRHRDKMTGLTALRRLKICDRLIHEDLNLCMWSRGRTIGIGRDWN
ncbi:hypothetical protein ACHAXT_005205, partial [Thalassiosira profunda]